MRLLSYSPVAPGPRILAWLTFALFATVADPVAAQSVERGREVFKLCEGCHSVVAGEHRYGPSMAGIAGRAAGRLRGYQFSDALAAERFKWTPEQLSRWLSDEPKNMVPGTRMEFPGIADKADVQSLVRYLGTLKAR